jgi:hypothetical protein
MIRKSGSLLPVGSVASQSTSACAAALRVWLQFPWPSPVSGSPSHADPLDLRWLIATVKRAPVAITSKVWASAGRLRVSMNRGSTALVRSLKSPNGLTTFER